MRDDGGVSDAEKGVNPTPESAAAPPVEESGPDAGRHPLRMRMLVVIAAVVLVLDLVTKIAAVRFIEPGNPIHIIGDVVTLKLIRNPGAAFSMATGMTWLLTLVAIAVVVAVIKIGRTLRSPWWALGLGLVLGGALGNLIDRIFRAPGPLQGHVVDFVSVGWWPVFNVADSGVVCGAILLVLLTLFGINPDGTRGQADEPTDATTATDEPSEKES
ncbi:signal peptidase II [Rhodococcus sp. NPDC003348]